MSLPPPPEPPPPGDHRAPDPDAEPGLSDTDRRAIRRRVRNDRVRTVGLILGMSALIIGGTVAAALAGAGAVYLSWLPVGVVLVAGWLTRRQRKADGSATDSGPPVPATTATEPTSGEAMFADIAFSEKLPTWRGWPRDVGVARIRRGQVTIDGLKGQLAIGAPFAATVEQIKYCHWPLIRVAGSIGSGHETTAYLAVRGYPLSKFSAESAEIAQDAVALAAAINSARDPGR